MNKEKSLFDQLNLTHCLLCGAKLWFNDFDEDEMIEEIISSCSDHLYFGKATFNKATSLNVSYEDDVGYYYVELKDSSVLCQLSFGYENSNGKDEIICYRYDIDDDHFAIPIEDIYFEVDMKSPEQILAGFEKLKETFKSLQESIVFQ